MGIDLEKKHAKSSHRRVNPSTNPYIQLQIKLFEFLARRTEAKFNSTILKNLLLSKINRPPVSLSRIATNSSEEKNQGKIVVVVGKVVDDERLIVVPKVTVAALKFSKTAEARIIKAGGEAISLDQLVTRSPIGENVILVRGPRDNRKAVKRFGVPGAKGSTVTPKIRAKGRKFERAHGHKK